MTSTMNFRLFAFALAVFVAQLGNATTIMNTDWVQKHAPVAELQAHDFSLLGDSAARLPAQNVPAQNPPLPPQEQNPAR